jgi:hypothetical protein
MMCEEADSNIEAIVVVLGDEGDMVDAVSDPATPRDKNIWEDVFAVAPSEEPNKPMSLICVEG